MRKETKQRGLVSPMILAQPLIQHSSPQGGSVQIGNFMCHTLYYIISNDSLYLFFFLGRLTDEFRLCCLAREVKVCLPPADEFSSCEDLMSNLVLRVCVWVLASVAILGNILVIACRASYKHTNQVHRLIYFSCDYY